MLLQTSTSFLLWFRGSKPLLTILVVPLIFLSHGPSSLRVQVSSSLRLEQLPSFLYPHVAKPRPKHAPHYRRCGAATRAITLNAQEQGGPPAVPSNAFPHACSQSSWHCTHCGTRLPLQLKVSLPTLAAGNVLRCDCSRGETSSPVHFLSTLRCFFSSTTNPYHKSDMLHSQ